MVALKTIIPKPVNLTSNKGRSMGHTHVLIKIENNFDWARNQAAKRAKKKLKPIRMVLIPDAVVDTGTYYLSIPKRYIKQLGLEPMPGKLAVQTTNGYVERNMYSGARLTINDRTTELTILELPDDLPALIGVIPLEALDLLVDSNAEKLVGRNGDKQVLAHY